MLRLTGQRRGQRTVANLGVADQVIVGISLPSDTVVHGLRFDGQLVPTTAADEFDGQAVVTYALEAWLLPVDDPDATADFDDIWDSLVPKDTDVQLLDLDKETVDTTTFYEPGEVDWSAVMDVGLRPRRLWHHRKTLSINNTKGIVFVDANTPFTPKWQIGDMYGFSVRKPFRVQQPSVLLIGAGMPANDDTVSVVEVPLGQNEWPRVKYLGDTLILALQEVLGLTETGAETPWEEAADLLQRHLDPDTMETTAGFYASADATFFGELTIDHSVVGTLNLGHITTGR